MKEYWIDLSHPIHPGMPVYPGTEEPSVERAFIIESHGFREARIRMVSHTGTHMDAPSHMVMEGRNLDDYPIATFGGKAYILSVKGRAIGMDQIGSLRNKDLSDAWLLLKTGWSQYWGTEKYFEGFPLLSKETAEYIASSGLKGIGIDCISFDPIGDLKFENHLILLNKGLILVENLNHLERIPTDTFNFIALPLPIQKADGAPVRALAMVTSKD